MENKEVQEALSAVEDVESRARQAHVPWPGITAAGAALGLAFGAVLMDNPALTALGMIASFVLILVVEFGGKRTVRESFKQDAHAGEGTWSWKSFIGFVAVYTAGFTALQVLPHQNLPVAAATGAAVAGALIAAYGLMWNRLRP